MMMQTGPAKAWVGGTTDSSTSGPCRRRAGAASVTTPLLPLLDSLPDVCVSYPAWVCALVESRLSLLSTTNCDKKAVAGRLTAAPLPLALLEPAMWPRATAALLFVLAETSAGRRRDMHRVARLRITSDSTTSTASTPRALLYTARTACDSARRTDTGCFGAYALSLQWTTVGS